MRSYRSVLAFSLAACVAAACAPQAAPAPPPPDTAAIKATIEAANTKFANALKANDTATAYANYTADAIVMMSNDKAWHGRAELSKGFGAMMAAMAIKDMAFTTEEIVVSGDLAVESGAYAMTLVPKGGKEMKDEGKYVTVWQKQADSTWKIIRDISNTNAPATK